MAGNIVKDKELPIYPLTQVFQPNRALPIDARVMFSDKGAADKAVENACEVGGGKSKYYYGMKVCVTDPDSKISTWYTIQPGENNKAYLVDDHGSSVLLSMVLVGQDENGGNIYEQTYSDETKTRFTAPKGDPGISLTANGQFYFSVENNNLYLLYKDGDETIPDFDYNEDTGDLYLVYESGSQYIGNVKGAPGGEGKPGSRVVDIELVGQDVQGGNIYKMVFDDETEKKFVAPQGKKGEPGFSVNGYFTFDVDGNNDLYILYPENSKPPEVDYNPDTGALYLVFDNVSRFVGTLKGSGGESGKGADIHLEKGSAKNSIQQVGNTAGAKGYKIVSTNATTNGLGQYNLQNAEGIVEGMKYVACTSEMNAVGGEIVNVSGNTVIVNNYLSVPLNSNVDNPDTGDVYNYLIIMEDPNDLNFVPGSIGDVCIGYGAVSLGDGSIVFAKNGFSNAKKGKVLGKFGSVFGKNTEAGHCAVAGGEDVKALGSCSFGWGLNLLAKALGSVALGIGHKVMHWGQTIVGRYSKYEGQGAITLNDRFVVGGGESDTDRRNCFCAGYNKDAKVSYIKVGGQYVTATNISNWLLGLDGINQYDKAVKTSTFNNTLNNITSDLASRIKFEVEGDGSVYVTIKED